MQPNQSTRRRIRFAMMAIIVVLGAYWAGARYGPRTPASVEAVPASGSTIADIPTAPAEPLGALEAENVHIYHQAAPAVANIVTKTVEYDFFYNAVPVEGAGSGFVIDSAGHILTNYHVVENARTIEVTLGDQTRYKATYIGADQRNDIALIKIDAPGKKLAALPLGDSRNLQVGQRVLAIGNPFGFQSTLTTGVVSALGRTVQTSDTTFIDEAIQTDAAINRGNSGGPLMNSHGEVIGINSAIYTPSGTTAGIGFAIPINTARRVADDLINLGRVRQATLGIQGRAIWPGLARCSRSTSRTRPTNRKHHKGRPSSTSGRPRRKSHGPSRPATIKNRRRHPSRSRPNRNQHPTRSRQSPKSPQTRRHHHSDNLQRRQKTRSKSNSSGSLKSHRRPRRHPNVPPASLLALFAFRTAGVPAGAFRR